MTHLLSSKFTTGFACWLLLLSAGYAQPPDTQELQLLLFQGEQLRIAGRYEDAENRLTQALALAEKNGIDRSVSLARGALGYIYLMQHRYGDAEPLLREAYRASNDNAWAELAAAQANYLGIFYQSELREAQAEQFYLASIRWAEQASQVLQALQARLNLPQLFIQHGQ
ncbi:MAG: tetratricopeptide repeat protein, partial [Gammaproteobacteria bacterium]